MSRQRVEICCQIGPVCWLRSPYYGSFSSCTDHYFPSRKRKWLACWRLAIAVPLRSAEEAKKSP